MKNWIIKWVELEDSLKNQLTLLVIIYGGLLFIELMILSFKIIGIR